MLDSSECQGPAGLMVRVVLRRMDGGVSVFGEEGVSRKGRLLHVGARFVIGRREEVMVSVCAHLGERWLVVLLVFLVTRVGDSFLGDEGLVMVLGLQEPVFTLLVAH